MIPTCAKSDLNEGVWDELEPQIGEARLSATDRRAILLRFYIAVSRLQLRFFRCAGQPRLRGWFRRNLPRAAIIGALALGYLAGSSTLTVQTALSEVPFCDRTSFSALDWSIEEFEWKFEDQYTALISVIHAQTNWEIARRAPYREWLAARALPDTPGALNEFKAEFDERIRSNHSDWRKMLENAVWRLRGCFALRRAELDLLEFYLRLGMTNEFISLYQDLNSRATRPAGLSLFKGRYAALISPETGREPARELEGSSAGDLANRLKGTP